MLLTLCSNRHRMASSRVGDTVKCYVGDNCRALENCFCFMVPCYFFFFFKNIMCAGATHSEEKGRVGWGWIVGGGEWEEGHEQDVK